MALLGFEGFDQLQSSPEIDFERYLPFDKSGAGNAEWAWSAGSGQNLGKAPGLLSGYGIRTTNFTGNPRVLFLTTYQTFICGFRYKTHSGNVEGKSIILFMDNTVSGSTLGSTGTIQCRLNVDNVTGRLNFTRGDASQTILGWGTTVLVPDSWYFIEIKVTIASGVSGSVEVRLAGDPTPEILLTGVNTQTTANAWLNQIAVLSELAAYNADIVVDDLYACDTTGPAPFNDFLGVIRIETLYPTNIVSVQWTPKSPSEFIFPVGTQVLSASSNTIYFEPWTPTGGGVLTKVQAQWQTSFTGNIKAALYDATGPGGQPGNLITTSAAVTNPVGNVSQPAATFYDFTFGSPPTVVANTGYWIGFLADTANAAWTSDPSPTIVYTYAATYAGGFPGSITPASLVTTNRVYNSPAFFNGMNAIEVQEQNMDSDTSYNSQAATGIDLFGHAALQSTPTTIFGVAILSAATKSDVMNMNYRNKMVSSATTVNGVTVNLATVYVYTRDYYATDPATGLPWTGSAVNAMDFGYERY